MQNSRTSWIFPRKVEKEEESAPPGLKSSAVSPPTGAIFPTSNMEEIGEMLPQPTLQRHGSPD